MEINFVIVRSQEAEIVFNRRARSYKTFIFIAEKNVIIVEW